MTNAINIIREWLKTRKRERDAMRAKETYRELQTYGTLRREKRIVSNIIG